MRFRFPRISLPLLTALLVVTFGIFSSWTAFGYLTKQQDVLVGLRFNNDVDNAAARLEMELQKYKSVLYAFRGLIEDAGEQLTQDRVEAFARATDFANRYPNLSINFATHLKAGDVANFEKKTGLRVYPPSTNAERDVITFAIPRYESNGGLDISASTRRQAAVFRTIRETGAVTSSLIPFPNKNGQDLCLAARLGYYDSRIPAITNQERAATFRGSIGLGFRVESFFVTALGSDFVSRFHIVAHRIVGADEPKKTSEWSAANLVFDSKIVANSFKQEESTGHFLTKRIRVEFGQSIMELEFVTKRAFYNSDLAYLFQYGVALIILITSLIIAGLIVRFGSRYARLDRAIQKQNRQISLRTMRQEKTKRELIYVLENERRKDGQELHDDLGQELTAARYSLQYVLRSMAGSSLPQIVDLSRISETLDSIAKRLRLLARGLFPGGLDSDGLVHALNDLAKITEDSYGIECTVSSDDIALEDSYMSINLYRIAQEAVTNAIKHGQATRISIEISAKNGFFRLRVVDNGSGFADQSQIETGIGLRTMAYRAKLLGMTMNMVKNDGNGMTVEVMIGENNERK